MGTGEPRPAPSSGSTGLAGVCPHVQPGCPTCGARPAATASQRYLLTSYCENMQVPDTAAALRLPALEITDTMEEVGSLSTELTDGIRSSARAVSSASHLTTHGISYLSETMVNDVVPMATKVGKRLGRRAHGARIALSLLESTSSLCAVFCPHNLPSSATAVCCPHQTCNPRALEEGT
jgi:hypothetical protein